MLLRWLGQPTYYCLSNYPISFLQASNQLLKSPDQWDTFRCPVKIFATHFFLGEHYSQLANWLASPLHILRFFAGSHQHPAEGELCGSLQWPPFWEGRGHRSGGHYHLVGGWQPNSSQLWGGPLCLVTGPQKLWWVTPSPWGWHQLTISVMYSYLFLHFHLMFHHIIFQIFISSWSFLRFSLLIEIFFHCRAWGS